MPDPIWTQDDVDTLKEAVRSGVLSVTYSGPPQRTVTYQSLEAMRALLREMVADVAATESGVSKRFTKMGTRKGTTR